MAATANDHYGLVMRGVAENEFGVDGVAGDRLVGMLLALRPGGSVDGATDTFLVDAVVDVRVLGDEARRERRRRRPGDGFRDDEVDGPRASCAGTPTRQASSVDSVQR